MRFFQVFIIANFTILGLGRADTVTHFKNDHCPEVTTIEWTDPSKEMDRAMVVSFKMDRYVIHHCGKNDNTVVEKRRRCLLYFVGSYKELCAEEKFDAGARYLSKFVIGKAHGAATMGIDSIPGIVHNTLGTILSVAEGYEKIMLNPQCPRTDFIDKITRDPSKRSDPDFIFQLLTIQQDEAPLPQFLLPPQSFRKFLDLNRTDLIQDPHAAHLVIGNLLGHFYQMGLNHPLEIYEPFFKYTITPQRSQRSSSSQARNQLDIYQVPPTPDSPKFCEFFDPNFTPPRKVRIIRRRDERESPGGADYRID